VKEVMALSLYEQLDKELHEAMLAKQTLRVSTIRLIKAAVQMRQIEKRAPLSDDEILELINREMKQRRESLAEFEKAGRTDLIDKTKAEMEILRQYLPEQLSAAQLQELITKAVQQSGAAGPRDVGKVMGILMPLVKGKADGKEVNRLVMEALNKAGCP
jgi:uncharacterized protein YqeY